VQIGRISRPHITIERLIWQPEQGSYEVSTTEEFQHTTDGWSRITSRVFAEPDGIE